MRQIPGAYDSLVAHLRQPLSIPDRQGLNLALWVYGLFKARCCHLGRVADELPLTGQKDRLSQRLKRGLMNPRLRPEARYRQLIIPWLAHGPTGEERVLLLDRREVAERFKVLLWAVAFRGRAIPLTWAVLAHAGSCCVEEQQRLLARIEPHVPLSAKVALMADAEFRSVDLLA